MSISYSGSERGSASSSPWVLLCGGTIMKGNDGGRWTFDGMVLWLRRRRQNGDAVEWWGEGSKLR
jgi:hypothetical protein